MSTYDQYLSSYNSNTITLSNKDRLETNKSNESNASDLSENPNDLDIKSNSSSPEQSTLHNNGITVITNSLGETNLIKRHIAKLKLQKIAIK
ncbi:hypothetical protein F8M41_025901 [Gigaspora margarita]|uniref:Uncharacterized protein n=1 Tax=Gigaspora margarita TaxID=4874 RepID=A0A8H3XHP5_GIGMA|nr:hypothetical protein F8M41_025901 [Gigaspora margarita]